MFFFDKVIRHNIKGIPSAKKISGSLSVEIEANKLIEKWKESPLTIKGTIRCKYCSVVEGLKEFKELNDVKEFYVVYPPQTRYWKDSCIEIHYRKK